MSRTNVLAVIAQKGGAGKTTTVVHLAVYAAMQGLSVAIIDIDPQGSAYSWNSSRPAEQQFSAIKADAASLPGLLAKTTTAGVDLVIIDTPPHSSSEGAAAAKVADFAILPCKPYRFDLEAMAPTIAMVQLSKTPFAVFLNEAPQGFRLADEARQLLQANFDVTVLPEVVHAQAALKHALFDGRSIHEFDPTSKAAGEIEAIYQHIVGFLDLASKSTPARRETAAV